jgi:hypothetical protein
MRYFALFFTLVFVWFAWLQLNDPDPIFWSILYLIPAGISFSFFRGKMSLDLCVILALLYTCYGFYLFSDISKYEGFFSEDGGFSMKTPNQELAREAAGLGICALVYCVYICHHMVTNKISLINFISLRIPK